MNFTPNDDQESVLAGLDQLLASLPSITTGHAEPFVTSPALDAALLEAGFLDIASVEGFGTLEAALVVERIAQEVSVVEVASALIAPLLPDAFATRPLALAAGSAAAPARFLPGAKALLVDAGDRFELVEVDGAAIEPVESLLGYPYGRLVDPAALRVTHLNEVAPLRRRWRVALAAEAAGCMAAALKTVVDHVTSRTAFGRPLGAFQAIQHRLAMAAETAESTRWLALRAAWSDSDADAAIAAGFAQARTAAFTYDLHQFSGAMGLTFEFPLHLWTYRLRALVGEIGGASRQSRDLAALTWGDAA